MAAGSDRRTHHEPRPCSLRSSVEVRRGPTKPAGAQPARSAFQPAGGCRSNSEPRGPCPELAAFGAVEIPSGEYRTPTESNVLDSDATLWFGSADSNGADATIKACERLGRPYFLVLPGSGVRPSHVAEWLRTTGVSVLNVAGHRESLAPGSGERVERFLCDVFARLGHAPSVTAPPAC
jgi:hypothetical protein